MTTTEPTPIDKATWGDGPWQTEPDRVEWTHAGLPCLALRNKTFGGWCGYAAVPPGHPLHGVGYHDESPALVDALERLKQRRLDVADVTFARGIALLTGEVAASPDLVIDVHGGLTYADRCQGNICHVPKPGEPDDVWWFGFDCGHAGDFAPAIDATLRTIGARDETPYDHAAAIAAQDWHVEVYRTLDYVQAETNKLADQLAAIAAGDRSV